MLMSIGVGDGGREIDLDVDDADAVAGELETALQQGDPGLVWITDTRGRRVGVPAARIVYVEIEAQQRAGVGFSA